MEDLAWAAFIAEQQLPLGTIGTDGVKDLVHDAYSRSYLPNREALGMLAAPPANAMCAHASIAERALDILDNVRERELRQRLAGVESFHAQADPYTSKHSMMPLINLTVSWVDDTFNYCVETLDIIPLHRRRHTAAELAVMLGKELDKYITRAVHF